MFTPHLSEIEVERHEPSIEDLNLAEAVFKRRAERLARLTVEKELISSVKTTDTVRLATLKMQNKINFDNKREYAKVFIELFNKWRSYFCERDYAWRPKSMGQLKQIDSIVYMVREEGIDLDLFMACSFKAVARWKINVPAFNMMMARGVEWYYAYHEDILAEMDAHDAY